MKIQRFVLLSASISVAGSLWACKGSKPAKEDKAPEADKPAVAETTASEATKPPAVAQPIKLKEGAHNVGILIFDDLFITEFVAPFDIYKHVKDKMNVFLVAPTMDPITSYEGIVIHPHFSFANAPNIDVLVVPSGNQSTSADLKKQELIA